MTSTQSDKSLSFPPEETLDPGLPIERASKTDQTGQMHRLILAFDVYTCQLVPLARHQLKYMAAST